MRVSFDPPQFHEVPLESLLGMGRRAGEAELEALLATADAGEAGFGGPDREGLDTRRLHSTLAAEDELVDEVLESEEDRFLGDLAGKVIDKFNPLKLLHLPKNPLEAAFEGVVLTNIAGSTRITVPDTWRQHLLDYAKAHPVDGAMLVPALARHPTFRRGGWIMKVVKQAAAMTLDRNVFVSGKLSLCTYIHELVHVTQYGVLGVSAFLTSYFGMSAAVLAVQLVRRKPLDPFTASPHEKQAYALEGRFKKWYESTHPGASCNESV